MYVKWNSVVSDCFTITNGTRQGGVLSPYLFSRYIEVMERTRADSFPYMPHFLVADLRGETKTYRRLFVKIS